MRVWGRVYDLYGNPTWQVVTTDAQGFNDYVYVTALAQCLKLNLGESPFFANYGIPAHQSVMTQVAPDYYAQFTQQQYAQFFASLLIAKTNTNPPTYKLNITTHAGVKINASVPVPA